MTYNEALTYIASLGPRGWRLGLDRMQAFVARAGLLDALGAPGGPQYIHVAGTNGKGSVTAYLQSILVEQGYETGAFFSPYVFDPRERVQLGRDMISEREVAELTGELIPIAEAFTETQFGGITEFEFKTALAFLAFKRWECQWVALEVGLGGRLDATNVVTPRVSVIVSIGLDHTQILGSTHREIAHEKAGIIKPGVPAIVGEVSEEALAEIERMAADAGAPLWRYGREVVAEDGVVATPAGRHSALVPGIPGPMQEQNLALAVAALDAAGLLRDEGALRLGAKRAFAPGRFQRIRFREREFLLDGAHNPDAARVLRGSLEELVARVPGRRVILVTNMVMGHEPSQFYAKLAPIVSSAHVVPIDFPRATPVSVIAQGLRELVPAVQAHESLEAGLEAAGNEAGPDDLILVTGSFYLVGEAGRAMSALCT